MELDEKIALIERIPLFTGIPLEAFASLASRLVEKAYRAGTVLFEEGEPGDRFYLIVTGEINIYRDMGPASERLIGRRGAGEFIGEMSLLNPDGKRTASARAATDARLLELTRQDFNALIQQEPGITYQMLHVLSERLQAAHNESVRDLKEKNRQLQQAYIELQAAQEQIVEKKVLERELSQAQEIQTGMLPRSLPQLEGFDIGARMLPARMVGGDFFDVIRIDADHLALAIGDVSGKAMPAALFMALTLSLMRAEAGHDPEPVSVLRRVNAHLAAANDQGMFVTLIYGVLDRPGREFRYVRAGHEFPLLLHPDGRAEFLSDGSGQLIGLFPHPDLPLQKVILEPGSGLLLFTDGVTEARNPAGEFYPLESVAGELGRLAPGGAQDYCQGLVEEVMRFQGDAPQADDITVMLIRNTVQAN